eukprot:TRINITY_DN7007_c0_g2_i1.p1 TRINITY_DN7007_c0_g2~~TRINITY_DN7007_c0_g2_i1.p1  ORF type:complete len:186 (-),score=90.11 TRINITY_DN7007_c0_g2_i1:30-560(-)
MMQKLEEAKKEISFLKKIQKLKIQQMVDFHEFEFSQLQVKSKEILDQSADLVNLKKKGREKEKEVILNISSCSFILLEKYQLQQQPQHQQHQLHHHQLQKHQQHHQSHQNQQHQQKQHLKHQQNQHPQQHHHHQHQQQYVVLPSELGMTNIISPQSELEWRLLQFCLLYTSPSPRD